MAVADCINIGRYGAMVIVAAALIALAAANSGPAWEQDTGDEDGAPASNTFLDDGDFTTIDPPDASGELTFATGINDHGQIVGPYLDAEGTAHGFLRDRARGARGAFTTIDVPGALATTADDLNNHGQIVGTYSEVSNTRPINTPRAYLLDDGDFTLIDAFGADCTLSGDINDRGEFVGSYLDAGRPALGFLGDKEGVFTTIDVPGAEQTGAVGINNRGQIVGAYIDAGGTDPVFLCGEKMSPRSMPQALTTTSPLASGRGQALLP